MFGLNKNIISLVIFMSILILTTISLILSSDLFSIKTISVHGEHILSEDFIVEQSFIDDLTNIFIVNTSLSENLLSLLPEVKSVDICRTYPDRIDIHINEYEPIAVLIDNDRYIGVSSDKIAFSIKSFEYLPDIPVIYDIDKIGDIYEYTKIENNEINEIIDYLNIVNSNSPNISDRISEITYARNEGIVLQIGDGLEVIVGKHDNYEPSLLKLVNSGEVIELEKDKLSTLDLRFSECVILRYARS